MQEQLEEAKSHIKDGQLPKALKQLASIPPDEVKLFRKRILHLNGRLKDVYKEQQHGIITTEQYTAEVNKIRISCLDLIFEIEAKVEKERSNESSPFPQWSYVLLLVIVSLFVYGIWSQVNKEQPVKRESHHYHVHASPALDTVFDILIYPFSSIINDGQPEVLGDVHKLLAAKLQLERNINIELVDTIDHNLNAARAAEIGRKKKMNLVLWGQKSYLQDTPDSVFLNVQYETIGNRVFGQKMPELYSGQTDVQAYNSKDVLTSKVLTLPVRDVLQWILANKAFAAREWALAAKSFEDILKNSWYNITMEDQVFLLLRAAGAYAHDQQFARSKKLHQEALSLLPDNARAYLQLGMTYKIEQKLDSAIYFISKAIKLEPSFHVSYNNRASIYQEQGDLSAAIADFTQAVQLDSSFFWGFGNRAGLYLLQGNHEAALDDYDHGIRIASQRSGNEYIASIYHAKKASAFLNLAQKEQNSGFGSTPGEKYSVTKTGIYLQKARAELDLAEAIEKNEMTSLVAGLYALQTRNLPEALYHFNMTEQLFSLKKVKHFNLAQALNGKAQVYFLQEKYKQAITACDEAIEIAPKTAHFYQTRSKNYAQIGLDAKASTDRKTYHRLLSQQVTAK